MAVKIMRSCGHEENITHYQAIYGAEISEEILVKLRRNICRKCAGKKPRKQLVNSF